MYIVIRRCELGLKAYDGYINPVFCETLEEAKKEVKTFLDFCANYRCDGSAWIAKQI